jgi:glycosyltransferase involved in cell wall biosynthesis
MKVLLVGKSADTGGAAIASYRLMEILRQRGVDVNLLVQEGGKEDDTVFSTTRTTLKRWINFLRFVWERLLFLRHEKSKEVRFLFSLANTGERLVRNRQVNEADIIHLQWVNAGFLSRKSIRQLLDLGKPVVWTFHDMWAFTGGCHHALSCERYKQECGECIYLKRPGINDLSHRLWVKKKQMFSNRKVSVITPSQWLRERVRESSLLGHMEVHAIHNPVDQTRFRPVNRELACTNLGLDPSKKYILFGASSVKNLYKGFNFFREAIQVLEGDPDAITGVEILIFGKIGGDKSLDLPLETHIIDYVKSEQTMVDLYNVAHLYVISSLQDNFPGTIVEAMLCGTPVTGFRTGGIPEMISHLEDGYLAEHRSVSDLAEGMKWILSHGSYPELSRKVRGAAVRRFSVESSAERHVELYRSLLDRQPE